MPVRYLPDDSWPAYTYVPGRQPHPIRDPGGHMHGAEIAAPPPPDPTAPRESHAYLRAIDLFNHGYYWEAHEEWEGLWHACGRRGELADFLKSLIKLAAAGVKAREGNIAGVRRHAARAAELLTATLDRSTSPDVYCLDLPIAELRQFTLAVAEGDRVTMEDQTAESDNTVRIVFDFPLVLRPDP